MNTRLIHAITLATMAGLVLIGCGSGATPMSANPTGSDAAPATSTSMAAPPTTAIKVEPIESIESAASTTTSSTALPETTTTEVATTLPIEATNRPDVFADYPHVALIGPPQTGAGVGPTFEWAPVDGAVSYRLSVLGPDGPIWLWEGADTSVALALRPDPRPASAPALEIVAGSSWSVAALDGAGNLIAISGSRPVSPAA